jgi:hypothetical protein
LIASTTSEPSRVTNGRHSVQPVATSTIVRVWMNEPATDVPPWATMSTSQKPGGGLFQSLNLRIGTSRRIAEQNPERRRLPPLAAIFKGGYNSRFAFCVDDHGRRPQPMILPLRAPAAKAS